jgi:membrane protease subunit (stomatin/prohibitin family)
MQKISQNKIKRLSQAKRQELSAEWEASNLNQAEFCKQKGINLNSFVYWRSTVRQKDLKVQTSFLPAAITAPMTKQQQPPSGVMLRLPNGISLQISANTDKAFLQAVFNLLGVTAC